MSPSQFARVPGFVGSPLAAMNPKLLQGRVGQMLPPTPGFRAFFSAPPPATPPPPQQPPSGPGPHLQNLRLYKQMPLFIHCWPSLLIIEVQCYCSFLIFARDIFWDVIGSSGCWTEYNIGSLQAFLWITLSRVTCVLYIFAYCSSVASFYFF